MPLSTLQSSHVEVRATLQAVSDAIVAFEQRNVSPSPRGRGESADARERRYPIYGLLQRWEPFRLAVEAHMEREESLLPGLQEGMLAGALAGAEVRAVLESISREHEELHRLSSEVRLAALGIVPLRGSIDEALAAVFRQSQWEDTRLLPALARQAGVRLLSASAARYTDDARLSRQLRSSLSSPPAPESPRRRGLLARLLHR